MASFFFSSTTSSVSNLPLLVPVGVAISVTFAVVVVVIIISRLFFHRLSKVPGPKFAAISTLYEFYYDCIQGGQFYFKIIDLHQQYGPIVRIGPREVHIDDPFFFDRLYNVKGKLDKDPWYYRFLGTPQGAGGTETAELHRIRRKPMAKFFSPAAYKRLEQPIMTNVGKLSKRMEEFRDAGKPLHLSNAFRCLATDNVTDYSLPHGFNMMDDHDFAGDFHRQARNFASLAQWNRHCPVIIPLFMLVPRWLIKLIGARGSVESFDFQMGIMRQTIEVATSEKRSDETVVHGIINSDLPEVEKAPMRVFQDAQTLVGAASETTATTLEAIVFYVLSQPEVRSRLGAELATVVVKGETPSYDAVRNLPYLGAVINEALRIMNSICGRLPRVDPRNDIIYGGFVLPAGTVISMSIPGNHMNPEIYPEPTKFDPDRWLRPGEKERSKQFLVPFGQGSRICLGKDFAMISLYVITALLFGTQFDLELFETTQRDIDMAHDYFAPFPARDANGVRVLVK